MLLTEGLSLPYHRGNTCLVTPCAGRWIRTVLRDVQLRTVHRFGFYRTQEVSESVGALLEMWRAISWMRSAFVIGDQPCPFMGRP